MKALTLLPGIENVGLAGRAVANAIRTYDAQPDDAGWLAFRTAVDRMANCMQVSMHHAPSTPAFDEMRSAATEVSEAAAVMQNAGGRLSPGAEQAVVEMLDQAAERWAAAIDVRTAALQEWARTHDPDRTRPARTRRHRRQQRQRP